MTCGKAIILAIALLLVPGPFFTYSLHAEDGIDPKRVDAAVKKGCEFLKGLQKPDGTWPLELQREKYWVFGTTALCMLTLLKGGEPKDSPAVKNALNYLKNGKYMTIYEASVLIMALAALVDEAEEAPAEEAPKPDDKPDLQTAPMEDQATVSKKRFNKAPPWLKDMIKAAFDFIVAKKTALACWRYPMADPMGQNDFSNTQYAMMGIITAGRFGLKAPDKVIIEVAEYLMAAQEQTGPEIDSFPVPAADLPLKGMKDMEKEWMKNFNKLIADEKKKAREAGEEFKGLDMSTAVERENPYDKFGKELPKKFNARGWAYIPPSAPSEAQGQNFSWAKENTGSMTCSGTLSLVICKANLEDNPWYKKNGDKLVKSIRDGCAWIVKSWKTDMNPGATKEDTWRYYYFYALERAGVIALVHKFGPHDWHTEVGNVILGEQGADGSWKGVKGAIPDNLPFEHGPIWETCFAILFLKKATTPIVSEETIIYTGEGLIKGGWTDKKEKPEPPKEDKPAPAPEEKKPDDNEKKPPDGGDSDNSGE